MTKRPFRASAELGNTALMSPAPKWRNTMDLDTVVKHCEALESRMMDKGWRNPEARFTVNSGRLIWVIQAKHPTSDEYSDGLYKTFGFNPGESAAVAVDEAYKHIRQLITAEDAEKDEYLKSLARAVELGTKYAIDQKPLEEFLDSIRDRMLPAA